MNRRNFVRTLASTTAAGILAKALRAAVPERPNVIFILADDLGYGDLSCYGRPDYKTPALDRMAREGMRFTDAYAAAPVCTPTRCAFHTGRYPHRLAVGLQQPLTDSNMQVGIPPDQPTVASLLKHNDYETALVGKWHLGNVPKFGPNQHGFDEFFGINGSSADYFTYHNVAGRFDLYENLEPSKEEGYLTDLFTERAIRIITRKRSRPFFLSLQYNAPHWPWEGPADKGIIHNHRPAGTASSGNAAGLAGGSLAIYAEMMKSMDAGIGRLFQALKAANLDRKTLVIFTSDNGGEQYSYNWPFSLQKMNLWEGGIRIPAIVRWPGVIPASKVTSQAAITMDWTATILAVTGTKPDAQYPLDGIDLMPVCTGERVPFDRSFFWRITGQAGARNGKWKYIKTPNIERLWDLAIDPGEKNDLKAVHPDILEELRRRYQEWNAGMLPNP